MQSKEKQKWFKVILSKLIPIESQTSQIPTKTYQNYKVISTSNSLTYVYYSGLAKAPTSLSKSNPVFNLWLSRSIIRIFTKRWLVYNASDTISKSDLYINYLISWGRRSIHKLAFSAESQPHFLSFHIPIFSQEI